MFGKEALFVLANLSQIIAEKMEEPILHVPGLINGQISIAVVVLYSHMTWGVLDRDPEWELGSGLELAQ